VTRLPARRLVAGLSPLLLLALALPGPRADADAASCSSANKIVGTPGGAVTGTSGADWIETDDAVSVIAGDGDDCVFVTGRTDTAGKGPQPTIDLGPGDDMLELDEANVDLPPAGTYDGGEGTDLIRVGIWAERDVALDLQAGTLAITADAPFPASATTASGFEDADVSATNATVTGTEGPNDLTAFGCHVDIFGLDGDDRLSDALNYEERAGGDCDGWSDNLSGGPGDDVLDGERMVDGFVFDGGEGRDLFLLNYASYLYSPEGADVVAQLGGRITFTHPGRTTGRLPGIEDTFIRGGYRSIVVEGTSDDNDISAKAICRVELRGLSGADVLDIDDANSKYKCGKVWFSASGGSGEDQLTGSRRDDLLVGGPGRDTAKGRKGRDTCRVEVARQCER
jgi:Ca2+-binding RTX toxin-like protein